MPRISFSVVLTAFLLIALIFLLRSTSPQPSYYRDVFGGHGRSLSDWLHREEERYATILQERERLVLKWGPTNATVDP
jgi:hypothetical protein